MKNGLISVDHKLVHNYTIKFMKLFKRNNLMKSDNQQVAIYLNGLRVAIQDKLGVQTLENMAKVQNMAEVMMKENKVDQTKKNFYQYASRNLENNTSTEYVQIQTKKVSVTIKQQEKGQGRGWDGDTSITYASGVT